MSEFHRRLEQLQIQIDRLDSKLIQVKTDVVQTKPKDPMHIILKEIEKVKAWSESKVEAFPTVDQLKV